MPTNRYEDRNGKNPTKERVNPNQGVRKSGRISAGPHCVKRPSKDLLLTPFKNCIRGPTSGVFSISAMSEADASFVPNVAKNEEVAPKPVETPQKQTPQSDDEIQDKYKTAKNGEEHLKQEEVAVHIVQALAKYVFLEDERNVELAMRSLRNLSIDAKKHIIIAKAGGIRTAISAMEQFPTKTLIQQLGLLFLGEISRSSETNRIHIGQSGGLQLINRILTDGETYDFILLERACITLQAACKQCEFNALLTGVCGSIDAVLKAMRRWKRSAVVQERCLACLATIVHEAPENTSIMTDSGGTSEILLTIRQYRSNIDLQVAALNVISEVAKANEAARENMGCTGILDDIQNGFELFQENRKYVLYASKCLRYFAFSATNRERIVTTTLPTILITRLEKWRSYRDVASSLLQSLANITFDTPEGKRTTARNNGATIILATLSAYSHDSVMCANTCRLLRNLSDGCLTTKRMIGRNGTIGTVCTVIQRHESDVGTQEHGCAMLINLLPTHEQQIRNADLEAHLTRMQAIHAKDNKVRKQVDFLLQKMLQLNRAGSKSRRGNSSTRSLKERLGSGQGSRDVHKMLSDQSVVRQLASATAEPGVMEY